jgi:hypothetical protein
VVFPVDHPFWIALFIAVPLGVLSALVLYMRAEVVAHALGAPSGTPEARAVRRAGWAAFGFAAAIFAVAAILFYSWLAPRWPLGAAPLYRALGVSAALVLSLAAWVIGARSRSRGISALVVLNVIWAAVLGWVVPAAVTWWRGTP